MKKNKIADAAIAAALVPVYGVMLTTYAIKVNVDHIKDKKKAKRAAK